MSPKSQRTPRATTTSTQPKNPVEQVQQLAERAVLVPVGATEQHGPHLPSGTDTIVASGLCALASTMAPAIVAPPIAVGVSSFHGHELPGTFAVSAFIVLSGARACRSR